MRHSVRVVVLLLAALWSTGVQAHRLGESYLFLEVHNDHLGGRVEVLIDDLDEAFGLDLDGDGKTSAAELTARLPELEAYVAAQVTLRVGTEILPLTFTPAESFGTRLGDYVKFDFTGPPTAPPALLEVSYGVLLDRLDNHHGLLLIESIEALDLTNAEETVSAVFDPDARTHTIDLTEPPRPTSFLRFVWEGIWHIWIGFDHVLFLLGLLLPAVFAGYVVPRIPVDDFATAGWNVVKIVTLFTVAHSITLGLAALGIIALSSRVVESIIAASIIVVALNNIIPFLGARIAALTFAFGLFHGIGFASVLERLTLAQSSLLSTLLGFNLGVEIGQLAIIAVALPLLFALRNQPLYQPVILRGGSVALIVIGSIWLLERAADIQLL